MRCPSCDFSNEASAESCSQCGTPLSRELRTAESIELEEVTVRFDDDIGFSAGETLEPVGDEGPAEDSDTAEPSASSEEQVPVPPKEDKIGDLIGDRYEILSQLGQGGMGAVFLARDNKTGLGGRQVAIKRILKASERGIQRFLREAETIAQLNHQNIRAIFDRGEDELGHFLVMEFVDGESLHDLVARDGVLKDDQFADIVRGLARSLAFAHRKGVIHRDVKPANVMLAEDGTPKLTDFGLARATEESELSMEGFGMGTAGYAAPEQRRDASSVDHRADIYGLGATMYFLLTGRSPKTIRESRVPERWRRITLRCLEEKPEDRFYSVDDFLDDLAAGASSQSSITRQIPAGAELFDCPACATSNAETAQYCRSCGGGLFEACPKCSQLDRAGASFCSGCGTDIANWKLSEECFAASRHHRDAYEFVAAIKEAQEALKTVPSRGDVRAFLEEVKCEYTKSEAARDSARAASEEKNFDLAESSWREVLEIIPKDEEALQAIAGLKERTRSAEFSERHAVLLRAVAQGDWRSSVRILRTLRAWASDEDADELQAAENSVRGLQLARVKDMLQRAEDEAFEGDYEEAYHLLDQARKGGATEKTVEPIRKKFSTMEIEGSRAERSRLRKKRIRKTIFTLLIFTGGTFFGSVKLRDYNQGILDNSVALFLEQKSDSDWKVVTSQLGKLLPEPWGPQEHVALGNITQGMMGRKDDQENEERVLLRELCQNCPPSLAGVKEHAMGILQSEAKDRFWDGAEPEKLAPKVSDGTLKLNIQFDSFQSCAVNGKMVEAEPNGEDNATIIDLSPWKNEPGELRLEFVDEAGFVIAGKYFVKWDNIPLALEQPKISEPIFPDTDFEIRIKAQGKTLVDTGGIRIEGGTKTDTKRESGELLLTVQARELQPSETEATVRLFGKVEDSAGNISEEFSWSWEIIDKPLYQAGEFAKKGDYPEALEALKDWQSKELIPVKVRNQIYSISDKWSQQINEKSKSASLDDYFELRQQIESIQGALPAILEVVPGAEDLSIQLADQSHNLAIKNAEVRFGSTVSKWMESWKPPDPASNTSLPVSLKDFKIPGDTFWAPIKLADPKARLLPVELIHKQTGLPFQLVPEGTLRDGERHAILSPFYMAKTEVPADIFNGGEANSAANKITWAESDKWCKEKGLALPSESQWLFAAMGDTQGKKHPWGSFEEIEYANLKAPAGETSTLNQLDSHQKNASWCGVLNMVGHVEEWVRDGKVARSERALELLDGTRDPEYFVSGQSKGRIALGGSFQDELNVLKELRQYYLLDKSESYIGFRPIAQVDLRGPSLARGETISVNGEHPAGDSVETDALTFGEEVRVAPGGPNFQLSKVKDGIYKLRFIVPDFEEEEPKPESLEVVFFDTFKNASTFQLEISTWSIDARCEKWKREWDSSVRKSNQVVPFEKAHKGWLKLVKEDLEKEYIDQPNYDKTLKWAQEKYDARLREIKEDLKRKDEEEIQKDTKEQNEEKWGPKAADWLARETKKQDFPVDDDFRSGFSKINNVTVPRNLDGTGGFILRRVKHEKSGLKFIWIPKSSDRGGFYISETEVSWKAYGESGSFSNGPKRPNWRHDENHPVVNISQGNAKKWCDRMGLNLPSQAEWNFSASGPKGKPNKPQTGSVNIEALRGQDYPFSYTCPVTNPGFECWAGGLNWFGNVAELLHPDSKQVAVGYSWKNKSLQNVTEPAKSANHVGFRPIAHPRP